MILHNRPFAASDIDQSFLIDFNRRDSCLHDTVVSRIFPSQLTPEAEMQKVADAADISLQFFSAGANFWAIFGPFLGPEDQKTAKKRISKFLICYCFLLLL